MIKGSLASSPGETMLSHPNLRQVVKNVNLQPGDAHRMAVDPEEDVLIFVIQGRCTIEVDGAHYQVSAHDCIDMERASNIHFAALDTSHMLVCRASRR